MENEANTKTYPILTSHKNIQGKPYFIMRCVICGKEFETINPKQALVCSPKCKKLRKNETDRIRKRSERQPILKTCECCGKVFDARTKTQIFCSRECADIMKPQKHREWLANKASETYKDNEYAKTCAICGYRCMDLTPHIALHHKMNVDDYCSTYNCTREDLIADSANLNRSIAQTNSVNPNKKRFTSENNPGTAHGGRLSPFSRNFVAYDNLTNAEKDSIRYKLSKKAGETMSNNQTCAQSRVYWTNQGYTEDEAIAILKTKCFSLDWCIEKYGEEEGRKRWANRQEKWLSNYKKQNYSNISQDLFRRLENQLRCFDLHLYFATNGEEGVNNEYKLRINDKVICPDFYIDEIKLIIEFDGSYWHNPEKFAAVVENDLFKTQLLESNRYKVLRVKENDYRKNPIMEYNKCLSVILKHIATYTKLPVVDPDTKEVLCTI